jgi:predicted unusual protein kinase regulating ubiquinone biosynthesis (AarF/ABC1/UbiB family)
MPKKSKTAKPPSIPTTAFGRATKLLGAGAALLGREIAVRSLEAVSALSEDSKLKKRLEQARGLVEALSQLKGAAMKTGQLLSLEFSDLLPPEITEILRTLHDSSTFMPFEQVEKILRKELGEVLFADLRNISNTPISSASIGQVHSAELHGQKVAIKVQFPGVDKSIGADLALVRKAAESILWVQNKKVPLDGFFEECERVLKQEVDYKKEAKFSHKFGELVGDHEYYLVPKVFEEYSTRRVLTLSFMEGQRLGDWLKSNRSEAENLKFAERVLELLFLEFFEWGAVQTDPNFGNFLYRPETGQLVLLDFGACNFYTKKFRREMVSLLKAAMAGDDNELLRLAAAAGVLDVREADETKAGFCKMMGLIASVYSKDKQPFHFGSTDYLAEVRTTTIDFANSVRYSAPAKDLIFLNRKLGGMFHLLKDLGVNYDLSKFWQRIDTW